VMQRDNSAELRFRIVRKQRLERPLRSKARVLAGNLLDPPDKFGIQSQAGAGERIPALAQDASWPAC
jgi:hypothetical protein